MNVAELKKTANNIRKGIIMGVHAAGSGHPGGSLSVCEILTLLYFAEMRNIDPAFPDNPTGNLFFPRAMQLRYFMRHC